MTYYQTFILTRILQKYIRDELDEFTTALIRIGAEEIALDDWFVYVIEIAYHIGYARSLLADKICEGTYKKTKKLVVDNLIERLLEKTNENNS